MNEWIQVRRKKKYNNNNSNNYSSNDNNNINNSNNNKYYNNNTDNSSSIMLPHVYTLWLKNINSNDRTLNEYNKLCDIKNIVDFWQIFNNLGRFNPQSNYLFIMKNDIKPLQTDINNIDGGICLFKISKNNGLDLFTDLNIYMMCEKLIDNPDDLNGISINPKNENFIIKIWNKNFNNDITKQLNMTIYNKYKNIYPIYKKNNF